MIDDSMKADIKARTETYWVKAVGTAEFEALFAGKEIGHRIADYVDESTTRMLDSIYDTKHEVNAQGEARPRSMGDVWILSEGIYNPINVKAGEAGKNGQPNMVSLTKLIDALLSYSIDSYYLLIVKMHPKSLPASAEIPEGELHPSEIVPNVYFVDMLDYLDYVTFDSGPGQAMLKEKQFYEVVDAGVSVPQRTIAEKVDTLVRLLEDGDRRLIENRAKKMLRVRAEFEKYRAAGTHIVTQGGLYLG